MKKVLIILLSAIAMPVFLLAEEPVREWKSTSGQTIQASLDEPQETDDPAMVYLLRGGKRFRIPFEKLSPEDQEYVTNARQGNRGIDSDFEEVGPADNNDRGVKVTPVAGNRYALLIGVNEYAKPFRSLRYCVEDMTLLAECFQRLGIPRENIFLVTDDAPAERRPTGSNIRYQIEKITSYMREEDQLIVAFSGHGAMVDGESYLCPCDTNLENKDSIVSRSWVFEQLENCKAKQKVFIIDACRNEISMSGERAMGNARTLDDPIGVDTTHGFMLIASCSKSQCSWEHQNLGHGVFTYFLAQGLLGAAADEDGRVSILPLIGYASSKTETYVLRYFNKSQVPTLCMGEQEGTNFCLGILTPQPGAGQTGATTQHYVNDGPNDTPSSEEDEVPDNTRGGGGGYYSEHPRLDAAEDALNTVNRVRGIIGGFF